MAVELDDIEAAAIAPLERLVVSFYRTNGSTVPAPMVTGFAKIKAGAREFSRAAIAGQLPDNCSAKNAPAQSVTKWLSVDEASAVLGIPARTVRWAAREGHLVGQRRESDGRRPWEFDERDLLSYRESHRAT